MSLYIMMINGVPVNHPITLENILTCYPDIDDEVFKNNFAPFERVELPVIGVYEINDGNRYEYIDGVVKEVWDVRPMTDEEKSSKQENYKKVWSQQHPDIKNWVFNEETCRYDPPIPHPDDGEFYIWDIDENRWIFTYLGDGDQNPL